MFLISLLANLAIDWKSAMFFASIFSAFKKEEKLVVKTMQLSRILYFHKHATSHYYKDFTTRHFFLAHFC